MKGNTVQGRGTPEEQQERVWEHQATGSAGEASPGAAGPKGVGR